MKKIKIGIFGSCVSREIFNYDKEDQFEICQYFNFTSLFVQMSPRVMKKYKENELGHENKWYSKMIAADLNKDALEQIKKENPEYLILDLMSERLMLLEFINELGEKVIITLHNDIKKCKYFSGEGDREILNNKVIDPCTFDSDYIDDVVKRAAKNLLEICPADKIIFIESFMVEHYVDQKGRIKSFNSYLLQRSVKVNSWLKKLEELLLCYLDGCNVIFFPHKTIGDELHHLHLAPMHYCKNYYRYAYGNIKKIVGFADGFSATDMIGIDNEELFSLLQRNKN